jgi:uncharacterized membrane protein
METNRIRSVDLLRGLIMVLMAIDHVRVYSGLPAGGTEPGIFFTRWITHFCAPGFVFFAGTSAFLYGQKTANKNKLAKFLLTRGLLLVVLELTLIRFFWTFNWNYNEFILAGVIWMLGWCMVLLALFVRLQAGTIGVIGVLIIAIQQVFRFVPQILPASLDPYWEVFYPGGSEAPRLAVLYVLIPWIGVMMAGYGFGAVLLKDPVERRKICLGIGLTATVLFFMIGGVFMNSNTSPNDPMPAFFRLLNQQKYPPSQLYLMMTLGPLIALVPAMEKLKGWTAHILETFGRVPMFYYLLHILYIHLAAWLVNYLLYKDIHQEWYNTAPFAQVPPEQRWGLGLLYLVFFVVIVILYVKCRWYAAYKKNHPGKKWLSYL